LIIFTLKNHLKRSGENRKNVGAIAMKLMRDLVGVAATPRELLTYAWSQAGVATATVGHWGIEALIENIQLAQ
jgi:hypothetical protein